MPGWLSNALSSITNTSSAKEEDGNRTQTEPIFHSAADEDDDDDLSALMLAGTANEQQQQALRNREEMNGLIRHAKQVATQLQLLVERDVPMDLTDAGRPPRYDELVHRLNAVLTHQRDINQATSKMTSTNYVVNMVNFVRNRQLKALVRQGRVQLAEMQGHVSELEHQVDTLSTDVAVQQKLADRLKGSLDATRDLLDRTVVEYREEMARQRNLLQHHQSMLKKMYESKFNQDLIVDAGAFMFSFWLVRSSLLRLPLQGAASVGHWFLVQLAQLLLRWKSQQGMLMKLRSKDGQRFSRGLMQVVAVVFLMQQLRLSAKSYGLHSHVGSMMGYLRWFAMRMTNGASVPPPVDLPTDEPDRPVHTNVEQPQQQPQQPQLEHNNA